ncbi:MAG: outer membrane beta-barrel protein [Thermoanaerobaculia bacterium]
MNTIKQIVLCGLVSALLLPAAASAQARPWHFGVEAGLADPNRDRFDDALQIQGSVGYDVVNRSWGVLTGEFAVGTSVSEGDIKLPPRFGGNGEWDVTTLGLFITYRTDEVVFYPLARLGFQYADASTNRPGLFPRFDDSDTGLAAGIGAGVRFTPDVALELSWTRQFSFLDEDLDVIALGVRF